MSNTKLPLLSCEVAVRIQKGRTQTITIASAQRGAIKPGEIEVFQNNPGEISLKIDVPQIGQYSGAAYATLTGENAEDLCRNLAARLGLKIE